MAVNSRSRILVIVLAVSLLLAAWPAGAAHAGGSLQSADGAAGAAAPEAVGWVGNMFPAGGSSTTITAGGSFTVYVQVWKDGVTNASGQGAGIACTLYWGQVSSFGGSWSNITNTAMVYNTDIGNNDEYKASIMPGQGLYEFTAYCSDDGGTTKTWQGNGSGRLTVNAAPTSCSGATTGDNNVYWAGLFHDSFSASFRSPIGPVNTGQGTVTLKFRTCQNDVGSASIRVWNDRTNVETVSSLTFDSNGTVSGVGNVTYWKIDLAIPAQATILYYVFSATDGSATAYYRDDDPQFYGGGYGQAEASQATAYNNSYQLTVYDAGYTVPSWMQRGMVYQIFPERFRDGNTANDPAAGRFFYGANSAIVRSGQTVWNATVCDPRGVASPACADHYSDNFYGGDLAGITQKINDGYFDNLGVSVLYLNPIFRSPSNHKYDTADYLTIDPDFGTLADFQALAAAAQARGMKLILDGVFNHTASDSKYFDRYFRYDASGNVTSPNGVGADDNSGACEAGSSAFYSWYYFPDIGTPAKDNNVAVYCANGAGNANQTYEAWYGYSSLPKLQANSTAVRTLIWNNGLSSVGPYWTQQGADGWRFDVGGDVDCGLTCNGNNDYWEGFRAAVRNVGVTGKSDTLMLGEEWGDASAWLLGNEWDSVMNYRFRSALLSWLFTGCSGNGCTGGTAFADNDSNTGSASGAISTISPSQFNARLRSIAEDYPPMALKAMMNLEGSHDTNRVRFLLKKVNNDSDPAAVQRMKEWWLFAFTYPGAPTLYYGDEIGLNHDGVWASNKYEDDPYNRAPFPWPDASGSSYSDDSNASTAGLQAFARQMASIRWSYRALQDGDVQHGLVIDDANQVYGYARTNGSQTALIALNRSSAAHNVTFTGLNAAPYNLADGAQLVNALTGDLSTVYTVSGGSVTISVTPTWGAVLLEKSKIETPAAITDLSGSASGQNVSLTWSTVAADTAGGRELVTAYQVHRGTAATFTPGAGTLRATVTPSDAAFRYGSTNRQFSYSETVALAAAAAGPQQPAVNYYYKICPVNAPGVVGACTSAVGPLAVTLASMTAVAQTNAIQVNWDTVSEINNAGFNLYRATSPDGPWIKLNSSVIPSQNPGSSEPASYQYQDAYQLTAGATYYYVLEDVGLDGATYRHPDPVSATYGAPTAVRLAGLAARAGLPPAWPAAPALVGLFALLAVRLRRRKA